VAGLVDDADVLREFLTEGGEILAEVDARLLDLERSPGDAGQLNSVFRGFHTIKGGAGFLEAHALVDLCHRTENLFDLLRAGKLALNSAVLDVVLDATTEVRRMFDDMQTGRAPKPASEALLESLERAARGEAPQPTGVSAATTASRHPSEPDWQAFYDSIVPPHARKGKAAEPAPSTAPEARATSQPANSSAGEKSKPRPSAARGEVHIAPREATLKIDTARFDHILDLSAEIGLIRTRLLKLTTNCAQNNAPFARDLSSLSAELDTLVGDLQSAVMKARMQPVARVFQKYGRLVRDLGRQLGKDIALELAGEDTEVDKTILEELNDPLVHLLRNAVDHGVEGPEEREAAGKPRRATVRMSAAQAGDQIRIEIADDGKGMSAEKIRQRALDKGLITADQAAELQDRDCLNLIFLPGFSTKDQVSDLSGRGVGMDVVKTNIRKLNGRMDIDSVPGRGTRFIISLPLTLAILPVLVLSEGGQFYALPLSAVREVLDLARERVQHVAGRPALVVRGEALPLVGLASALGGQPHALPRYGAVVEWGQTRLVLGVAAVNGRDDVMVKPLGGVRPRGVAGATLAGDGQLVLVLNLNELIGGGAE